MALVAKSLYQTVTSGSNASCIGPRATRSPLKLMLGSSVVSPIAAPPARQGTLYLGEAVPRHLPAPGIGRDHLGSRHRFVESLQFRAVERHADQAARRMERVRHPRVRVR